MPSVFSTKTECQFWVGWGQGGHAAAWQGEGAGEGLPPLEMPTRHPRPAAPHPGWDPEGAGGLWKELCGREGREKPVQAPGTSDPLGAGLQGALEDRAHCRCRSAAAPNSAVVLLGFALLSSCQYFLTVSRGFSQTLATGAKNAAQRGLRAVPGAITESTLITGDGSGSDWAPIRQCSRALRVQACVHTCAITCAHV